MDGVINIFKPRGMTSHDAVNILRRLLNTKKVGHTGTLDPNATGVLPICIGKGTRISEYLLEVDKEYIGELTLGFATDTQDGDGRILLSSSKTVNSGEIENAIEKYRGIINQTPPMYSALKVNGKKLYELAREGKTIERESRKINIKDIKILNNHDNREIIFYTKCSRGTYIRTLCDDIGKDLGTYGYMSYLIRVGVGIFKIENAYSMEYLKTLSRDEISEIITPLDKAVEHLEKIIVADGLYDKIINGVSIKMNYSEELSLAVPYRIYSRNEFIGIGQIIKREDNLYLKLNKVFI
jgi:tRNA pseudouridine55 synthase